MRRLLERAVIVFSWIAALLLAAALATVVGYILLRGWPVLDGGLVFGDVSPIDALLLRRPVFDGLFPAIGGTLLLVLLSVACAVPVGLAAGIYLAEYSEGGVKWILSLLIDVLAGLPSVVVGLAGFAVTIVLHRVWPSRLGPCLMLSALSLAFLILPYLIRTTQLALESLPVALRFTAPALGADRWQNIRYVLLPACVPELLGGIILAIGRVAEDTAVIMLTGVVASAGMPRSLLEQFEALPFYIYYISSQYADPHELQMGFGAAVLLCALCGMLFFTAWCLEQGLANRWKR